MKIKTDSSSQATLCFLFSILLCAVGYSQPKSKALNKIYLQAAAGGASRSGFVGELAIQTVFRNKWVATISYHNIDMEPKNLPEDFDPGNIIIFLIPIPGETPSVDMNLVALRWADILKEERSEERRVGKECRSR